MNFLILLAAGNGSRMNIKTKKQYIVIKNKPLFRFSFDKFYKSKIIDKYILVINESDKNNIVINKFKKEYEEMINKQQIVFVFGGENRYDSVFNALDYIYNVYNDLKDKYVYIHDSARPFVDINDIKNVNVLISKYKAISLACKAINTMKIVDKNTMVDNILLSKVSKTLDRNSLYSIMTPQVFEFDLIYNSHLKFRKQNKIENITDDLQIVEIFSNKKTYLIDSNPLNIKITNKEDLKIYNNLF